MWNYSDKVLDHFLHPRNMGHIENPDAVGEIGNIACGDALRLSIKIDDKERIVDAKFETFGCASAIASSSALTELIKGKTIDEALKISNDDIADYLDGLPGEKMHCSVMGQEALEKAIALYKGEEVVDSEHDHDEKIVCKCFGVTDLKIARVVREHDLHTAEEVTHYCKAGGGCGQCIQDIEDIIEEVWGKEKEKAQAADARKMKKEPMTNIIKMQLVMETIEKEIRPMLKSHGGDIDLIDIIGDHVKVSLRGACSECVSSGATLKMFVEEKLREFVHKGIVVEEIKD
jgi:NifU-like protein